MLQEVFLSPSDYISEAL